MRVRVLAALLTGAAFAGVPATAAAQLPSTTDPRAALSAGLDNAGTSSKGLDLLAHLNKPPGWFNPSNPGDFAFPNSDIAFQGNYAFVGNFNGFNIYDISNPAAPTIKTSVVCPGGQGDLSVYKHLLFMSVEETRAKKDCTLTPAADATTRFRGVRIFDIIEHRRRRVQVGRRSRPAAAPTRTRWCVRRTTRTTSTSTSAAPAACAPPTELAGCDRRRGDHDPNPSQWRIEVIKVPLAAPADAAVVSEPRLFTRRGHRARSTACRTRRRRRCTRPEWPGAPTPGHRTPATTSPSTRSSTSPPAPARATAS